MLESIPFQTKHEIELQVAPTGFDFLATYPLLDAMLNRRSRRFGKGMELKGAPLAYASAREPEPLSMEEEAALAFAACGINGFALGELPYQNGDGPESGGGNKMLQFVGRTAASADGIHAYAVFVMNDNGVWLLRRPQDFERRELAGLIGDAREFRLVDAYKKMRIQIADTRVEIPRQAPFTQAFNKWDANVRGTTYFLPVAELSAGYINGLLYMLGEEFGGFPLDDHRAYLPAGVGKFRKSRGGHLHDDVKSGRVGPVSYIESWLFEICAVELGAMVQNLGLMTQALGLGGFPHFVAHPYQWFHALGFRMESLAASRVAGLGNFIGNIARALRQEFEIPSAVGLERDGEILLKPFCPPYYNNMREAVYAFLEFKFADGTGSLRDGGKTTAWRDGAAVQNKIPHYSAQTVQATIAYCDYIYQRYGRFPAASGPFRTLIAFQAHHLDLDFYQRFYRSDALSETQSQHDALWHSHA